MPSRYLDEAEYGLFGLPATTELSEVVTASTLVDAHLERPEGLIHDGSVMEATGRPVVEDRVVPSNRLILLGRRPTPVVLTVVIGRICVPFDFSAPITGWELEQWDGRLYLPGTIDWPSRARITFLSGFLRAELPADVKLATAICVRSRAATPDLPAGVKKAKAGDAALEWGAGPRPVVDDEVARLLAPYRRVIP